MGIESLVKKWLIQRYSSKDPAKNAFPHTFELWNNPKARDPRPGAWGFVLIVDMMQYMKHKPDDVTTLGELLAYIMGCVRRKIDMHKGKARVIILCWDQKVTEHHSNVVKQICYAKRYKNVSVYDEEQGPYLPKTLDGQLPPEWNRFCGNSTLLRRELYPHLYNCCLDSRYIQLTFGQRLVLQGLPGLVFEDMPGMKAAHLRYLTTGFNDPKSADALKESQQRLVPWQMEHLPITREYEREHPDLYNTVYYIEAVAPGIDHRFPQGFLKTDVWPEARNNLGEADLAMMFFDRFYPELDQVIDINDGDIIPIGLLYAQERLQGNTWRNHQLIQLPIKHGRKKKQTEAEPESEAPVIVDAPQLAEVDKPRFTFCDLNVLYARVCDDPLFGNHGVQNHVLMLVFMIVLSGTDFFKDAFGGINVQNTVWKTLTGKLDVLHHLVQSSKNIIPDPTALRTIVMDETAWRRLVYWSYVEKHGSTVRKRNKGALSLKLIKVHLNKRKRETERFPDRNLVRRWGRMALWNLRYWMDGPRYRKHATEPCAVNFPDPFLRVQGDSFYGYELDSAVSSAAGAGGKGLRFSPRVSTYMPRVDEVYAQHFLKPAPAAEDVPKKKRRLKLLAQRMPEDEQLDALEREARGAFGPV